MAVGFKVKTGVVLNPVFLKVLEVSQGGAMLQVDARIPTDLHTIFEGTPIATCTTSGQYMWMKSVIVATAKADGATRMVINGPNPFKVGEYVCMSGAGAGSVATITVVASTYIVTALTNFTLTKGQVLYQAAADGATAPKFRPYALLAHPAIVREADGTTYDNVNVTLVHKGSVATSLFKWGYSTDVKNRLGSHVQFRNKGLV